MIRKIIFIVVVMFQLTVSCNGQNLKYEGILCDENIDSDFGKGKDAILNSLNENIHYLNLYEMAHALPELIEHLSSIKKPEDIWDSYIDTLSKNVANYNNDTSVAHFAKDYKGLIPLQAEFFLATLNRNVKLLNIDDKIYNILSLKTNKLLGLGYRESQYDSLIVFNDEKGTTTFWYFLQIEDCNVISIVLNSGLISESELATLLSSKLIVSTYRIPYYLQKRKWQSIQRRLANCTENINASDLMKKRTIAIQDKNLDYFKLQEGIKIDNLIEF
jgi:hypothetical protein